MLYYYDSRAERLFERFACERLKKLLHHDMEGKMAYLYSIILMSDHRLISHTHVCLFCSWAREKMYLCYRTYGRGQQCTGWMKRRNKNPHKRPIKFCLSSCSLLHEVSCRSIERPPILFPSLYGRSIILSHAFLMWCDFASWGINIINVNSL